MTLTALGAGPFQGVFDSRDPFDDASKPNMLQDAQNMYCPDSATSGGFYARPGFTQTAPSYAAALTPPGSQMGAAYTMVALDGTLYRFFAFNGKLYRLSGASFVTSTDVTPVGVTIDASATPGGRLYMNQLGNSLIFTDGVNRPWIGTNLSATPITGTYIDIDGAAGAWTAQGAPVVYQGSLFFIAKTVPGGSSVTAGLGLVWSEPNQPATGYTQAGYANFWNLIEQSAYPIYALAATNNTLYYFRESSIGAVSGTPGSNFSSTATRDLVSANVGTRAPASVVQFLDYIYFVDRMGRPYRFQPGSVPEELWKQLRGQIDANPSYLQYPNATALVGVGCLVPQLNVVLLGGWSSSPTNNSSNSPLGPTTVYCFDAMTGKYYGRWSGATSSGLTTFDVLTPMHDPTGAPTIVAFTNQGISQHLYLLGLLSSGVWQDNSQVPTITAKTQRLGYAANVVWNATDTGTIITQSTAPVTVTVTTPYTASTTEITAGSPASSSDGTYRLVFGMDVLEARGIQVTMQPTTATSQWVLQRVEFPADSSLATLSDQ